MDLSEVRTFAIIQAIDLVKHTISSNEADVTENTIEVVKSAKKIEKFILTGK